MYLRLRSERKGSHVHQRVFVGPDSEHLALAGTLVMNIGEWQLFGAALLLGAKATKGHLTVDSPDEIEVVKDPAHDCDEGTTGGTEPS